MYCHLDNLIAISLEWERHRARERGTRVMSHQEAAPSGQYAAMQEVFDEAVSLFHLLRALAARLHGQGEMTAARRGILRGLERLGPQSVPQLARARPVSRQHIQ